MSAPIDAARSKIAADLIAQTANLTELASVVDAELAFTCYALAKMISHRSDSSGEPAPARIESAAYELMPFFGQGELRDATKVEKLSQLLDARYLTRSAQTTLSKAPGDTPVDDLVGDLRIYAEMVRGTAFPEHTITRINALFSPFEVQLAQHLGIGPIKAAQVIVTVTQILNANHGLAMQKVTQLKRRRMELFTNPNRTEAEEQEFMGMDARAQHWADETPCLWPATPAQIFNLLPALTPDEWAAMLSLFGYTPEVRSREPEFVSVQDYPLFVLSDERVVISHLSAALDAIFSFFDDFARNDPSIRDAYGKHVSTWMETQIETFAHRIFPKSCVIREACYPNPDPEGGETSADLVVLWGPFLLVIEAKGKAFKRRSLRGDFVRLKNDVSKNIAEAFTQAERLSRALEKSPHLTLKEKETGRQLVVRREKLQRIFPASVTLHHFAGLATQLAAVKPLGLFRGGVYPWSVSLDDMDVVTRFVEHPDAFLHYIERRLDIQRAKVEITADELDLFGHYLDGRLNPRAYWEHKDIVAHTGHSHVGISGGSERFDHYFNARFLGSDDLPVIKLDLPSMINVILQELRNNPDDSARWFAFALLGLSAPATSRLAEQIAKLSDPKLAAATIPRITFRDGDLLVVVMGNRHLNTQLFNENLGARTMIEKYRTKTPKAIGLGINLQSGPQIVAGAFYEEGIWIEEPEMEKILRAEKQTPTTRVSFNGVRPGRNDACPCGSGQKFKRCCIDRMKII